MTFIESSASLMISFNFIILENYSFQIYLRVC